jgi:hypothetical protein
MDKILHTVGDVEVNGRNQIYKASPIMSEIVNVNLFI